MFKLRSSKRGYMPRCQVCLVDRNQTWNLAAFHTHLLNRFQLHDAWPDFSIAFHQSFVPGVVKKKLDAFTPAHPLLFEAYESDEARKS